MDYGKKAKKPLLKISFGMNQKEEGLPEGAGEEEPSSEGKMEEKHGPVLMRIKKEVESIPGTEGIIAAIDKFLMDESKDGDYEETEKDEEGVFDSFANFFNKKNMKK